MNDSSLWLECCKMGEQHAKWESNIGVRGEGMCRRYSRDAGGGGAVNIGTWATNWVIGGAHLTSTCFPGLES
jgi:hypothetical protein